MACGAYARWDERCDELDHHLCNHNGDEPRVLNGEQGLEYSTVSTQVQDGTVGTECMLGSLWRALYQRGALRIASHSFA